MLTDLRPAAALRPTNMAEAFIDALVARAPLPRTRGDVRVRVYRCMQKPGVGLVDNNTGRAPRKERK